MFINMYVYVIYAYFSYICIVYVQYAINQNELVQIHKWYPESEDVTFIKYNANKDNLLVVHHEVSVVQLYITLHFNLNTYT